MEVAKMTVEVPEKEFPLAVILTITTGRLLCDIGQVYEILGFMSGEKLFTHQLPRVGRECDEPLLEQHADLRQIEPPEDLGSEAKVNAWLATLTPTYGAARMVRPLRPEDHTSIGPLTEFAMRAPGVPVVPVILPDERGSISTSGEGR